MPSNKERTSRKFSLVTYLSEQHLKDVLSAHSHQIKAWAYAYHYFDKNEDGSPKVKHCHVILYVYNVSTVSRIRKWFRALDDDGKEITTTAQICNDISSMWDYLIHANNPEKYQYPDCVRESSDRYFFMSEDPLDDNSLSIVDDLLSGLSVYEMVSRYGRDFCIHFGHYVDVIKAIRRQSEGLDPFN